MRARKGLVLIVAIAGVAGVFAGLPLYLVAALVTGAIAQIARKSALRSILGAVFGGTAGWLLDRGLLEILGDGQHALTRSPGHEEALALIVLLLVFWAVQDHGATDA